MEVKADEEDPAHLDHLDELWPVVALRLLDRSEKEIRKDQDPGILPAEFQAESQS